MTVLCFHRLHSYCNI